MAPPTQLLLAKKLAVITGAGSATGEEIARKFVEHGAKVFLTDINLGDVERIAEDLNKAYNQSHHSTLAVVAKAKSCDVRHRSEIHTVIELAKAEFKQDVDILYNNACVKDRVPPIEYKSFQETMKVNVEAVVAGIEYAGAAMRKNPNGGGCILCTGSTTGLLGGVAPPTAYSISKEAVVGVVRAAAAHLAKDGVRVNAISPRRVAPSFDEALLKQLFPKANVMELDEMNKRNVANPVVSKEDVANAAVYLASDASKGVTGQNLVLNGKFALP